MVEHKDAAAARHPFTGLADTADDTTRQALAQDAADKNKAIRQTGGVLPGLYVADGAGGWKYVTLLDVDAGDVPDGTLLKREGNKFVGTPAGVDQVGGFFNSITGKADGMVWTDIGIASQQSQASGIIVAPPTAQFIMIPWRLEFHFAALQLAGRSELITGWLGFDDGVGTPDTRLVVQDSTPIDGTLDVTLNDITVASDGEVSIVLTNGTGDATNIVRGVLTVGPAIVVPFDFKPAA